VINGVSFIAVITALLLMKLKPFQRPARVESAFQQLRTGLSYVAHHVEVRTLIGMLGITSVFGMGFITLIPDWAVEILKGGATTNGLLQSARGIGSMLGALIIASLGNFRYRGKLLSFGLILFPVMLLIFAEVRWVPLSLFVMVLVGWGFMVYANLTNNLVQHHVPDELRGRVMGIYSLTFFGLIPIGALIAGTLAEYLGAPTAVVIMSAVCLFFALLLWFFMPRVRNME
jgi:predicted MFS family arabinose efflux permease